MILLCREMVAFSSEMMCRRLPRLAPPARPRGWDDTGLSESNVTSTVSASRSSHASCCSISFALGFLVLFDGGCCFVGGDMVPRPRVDGGIFVAGAADATACQARRTRRTR